MGGIEMAWLVRELTTGLREDLGSVPSTLMAAHTFFWLP